MKHLSPEELTAVEVGDRVRDETTAHLLSCTICREEQLRLREALAAVAAFVDEKAEPRDGFENRTWERLEPKLGTPAGQPALLSASRRFVPGRPLAWGGLAAALLLAFLAGRHSGSRTSPSESLPQEARDRILFVTVGQHLERSQMVLIELSQADPTASADLRFERRSAQSLLASNRLYRQVARRSGENNLAAILEELERVLIDIAHRPDQVGPKELAEIQQRIASRGLLLKVRVLNGELRQKEKSNAPVEWNRVS